MRRCRMSRFRATVALIAALSVLPLGGVLAAGRSNDIGKTGDYGLDGRTQGTSQPGGGGGVARPGAAGKSGRAAKDEPALLTSDELTSDESLGLVIARGHVELSRGGRVVQADTVTYNQKTRVVIAAGGVKLFEPSGEVMFSDYAELTDDLRDAFINNVRIIMSDNSRATGTEAERAGGRYVRMNHATYSPCYLCSRNANETPLWQLRAAQAVHDTVDKEIRYTDAVMEVFDVPLFYAPYFSHPDPTVKRRSGFLTPTSGHSSSLGYFLRDSYYYDIAPDLDATLEGTIFSAQAPMIGGEVRKRWDEGALKLAGSLTYASLNTDSDGNPIGQDKLRGYLHGSALFNLTDSWRVGGDVNLSSDQSFLRQYYNYQGNMLVSRGFAEGFWGRDYASVEAYRFQDLRVGNPQIAPTVAPLVQYALVGEPNGTLGGRWSLDAGLVGVTRSAGPDSTRVSLQPGWSRELVSDTGLVTTVTAQARTDIWHYQDYLPADLANLSPALRRDGAEYRLFPEGQIKFGYPLVRNGDSAQEVIEPLAALTAAPRLSRHPRFPNEDGREVELDAASLFAFNRFVGQDRQEGGQRLTYGVRGSLFGFNQGKGSVFLGQDYRLSGDHPFDTGTGLEYHRSDYVGHIDVAPASWLNLSYDFNYDSKTLDPRRETLAMSAGVPALRFTTSYHYDRESPDPNPDILLTHRDEYIGYGVTSQLTRHWSGTVGFTQALTPDPGLRSGGVMFSYGDECLVFQSIAALDFTTPVGSGPSQTVYFRLVFKNIGEFVSPGLSPSSMFGAGSASTTTPTSPIIPR